MRIAPISGDAVEFTTAVNQVIDGLLLRYQPPEMIVIQIDNWFGPKWLSFSGVIMPQFGWWKDTLTVPPFVPGRVVSQRKFDAPLYREVESSKPIHRDLSSQAATERRMTTVVPGATVLWYSGNSFSTGRGSMMVYLKVGDTYYPWYAQWEKSKSWKLAQTVEIELADLVALMDLGRICTTAI